MQETVFLEIINYLKKHAQYADLRATDILHESIAVKNLAIDAISKSHDAGYGIRVLSGGSWGFASSPKFTPEAIKKTAAKALELAKSSGSINKKKIIFPAQAPVVDKHKTPCEIDPFEVPLDKKLDYLMWACQTLKEHPSIKTAKSELDFYKTKKLFFNTEGSRIEQEIIESGGYIEATAVLANEFQKRSYPTSHHNQLSQAGYEYVKSLDLAGEAGRVRKEAVTLLRAKELPYGETTLILDGSQMALQIHESCGHPVELDRALGEEESFAGTSFLTPDKLNKFRYGSKLVNIVADATAPGGLGTFGYDDEGTKAQRVDIIKNGLFVGYLSSRETAAKINRASGGAMRCGSWCMTPIIRMTNINLLPGDTTLEELISDTKNGIFMSTNKSWSIDDKRLNFQFGCEIAWQIKKGKITEVYKNPLYAGITPRFWSSLSGIANKDYWKLYGIPNCAKGEPMQLMHVGHGTSPARFEKVRVGRKR
ncbi:MAG: TldD/PmbA family protein [Candidatus Omnitrophota bacterium]